MKTNLSLVYANQMKRLINASNNFFLIIVKEKFVEKNESFTVVYPKLKNDLIKVVYDYDILFQEPKGLPPKREIKNEIYLQ